MVACAHAGRAGELDALQACLSELCPEGRRSPKYTVTNPFLLTVDLLMTLWGIWGWGPLQGCLALSISLWGTGDSWSHIFQKCPQIKLLIGVAMAALAGLLEPFKQETGAAGLLLLSYYFWVFLEFLNLSAGFLNEEIDSKLILKPCRRSEPPLTYLIHPHCVEHTLISHTFPQS